MLEWMLEWMLSGCSVDAQWTWVMDPLTPSAFFQSFRVSIFGYPGKYTAVCHAPQGQLKGFGFAYPSLSGPAGVVLSSPPPLWLLSAVL